jgi:hypothetical protein
MRSLRKHIPPRETFSNSATSSVLPGFCRQTFAFRSATRAFGDAPVDGVRYSSGRSWSRMEKVDLLQISETRF